ncbi:MAG: thymidine kinase [Phycisphaerae bacterium]|nr:thymidine kinase [Phycisphaerae bacterium]
MLPHPHKPVPPTSDPARLVTPNGSEPGRLEVICGCMFAGKTTELIARLGAAKRAGQTVTAISPRSDTRSGDLGLCTHDGIEFGATRVQGVTDLLLAVGTPCGPSVIGIDEGHFFGAGLTQACLILVNAGRRVIVAGVHLDASGRPFEPFDALACHADRVDKLFAPCAVCGRPAVHSHRKSGDPAARLVVGGAERYEPRCRSCFPVPGIERHGPQGVTGEIPPGTPV